MSPAFFKWCLQDTGPTSSTKDAKYYFLFYYHFLLFLWSLATIWQASVQEKTSVTKYGRSDTKHECRFCFLLSFIVLSVSDSPEWDLVTSVDTSGQTWKFDAHSPDKQKACFRDLAGRRNQRSVVDQKLIREENSSKRRGWVDSWGVLDDARGREGDAQDTTVVDLFSVNESIFCQNVATAWSSLCWLLGSHLPSLSLRLVWRHSCRFS